MPELEAGDMLGPYRLESVLGEGAMGIVYRAVDGRDGRVVALKVLRDELSDSDVYRKRFEREGRVARDVSHAHLVPVLDSGRADGQEYLATRYVEGETLAARISRGAPLPTETVLRLVGEIGAALDVLHRSGLVHRDVKPANVLLDGSGNAALTDFGLARGTAHTVLTTPGRVVGTLDYLAPEVIRGDAATAASDVYALGCVAYECLTGRPPFAELEFAQVALAHLEREPADPCPDSPGLGWAVRLALAKQPADRPATGVAYARLLAVAASGGTRAGPPAPRGA